MSIVKRWGTTNPLASNARSFQTEWTASAGITLISGGSVNSSVTYQIGTGTQTLTYNALAGDAKLASNSIALLFSLPGSSGQSGANISVSVINTVGAFVLNNVSIGSLHDTNQALLNYSKSSLLSKIIITFTGFTANPQITFSAVNLYFPATKIFNGTNWITYPASVYNGSSWNLFAIKPQ